MTYRYNLMKYITYGLICLVGEFVGLFAAFILPFWCKYEWKPWVRLFATPDNPPEGDKGHQARWENKPIYWQRVAWLLRNRMYGLKLYVIGCPALRYTTEGNPRIKNRDGGVEGSFTLRSTDGEYWYKKTIKYIGYNYCIQLAFGWQLDAPIRGRCLFMFSPRVTKFYK